MDDITRLVRDNLAAVLAEISAQHKVGAQFPPELQSFSELIKQIREYILEAGEYGLAYEVIVATLEAFPFCLSGPTVIRLLEVGLLLGYKTKRAEDVRFACR